MKRKSLHSCLWAGVGLLAFGALGLASCSGNGSFTPATVRFSETSITLSLGESKRLRVSVSKGYDAEMRWFSSNENVVLVDDGYAFAVGVGSARVTAAYAGGYAECEITVTDGGGQQQVERLSVSPTSKTIQPGDTFTIRYSAYPADTTVTFASDDTNVATVTDAGVVTGVATGNAVITATGSNGKTAFCAVTVSDNAQPGGDERDIAVPSNLNYTGSLTIGSPLVQTEFMQGLLADFNEKTGSSINFTVNTFEEDNGTSGYPNAAAMPAVFPYASDQTLSLYQYGALSTVGNTDSKWIRDEMGTPARSAATLSGNVVGYPFAADNGVAMFYNTDYVTDPSQIDTVEKIFALADENDLDVNYSIGTGFYAAGALMTYNGGQSMYTMTPTLTSYTSEAHFNSENGLKAAKMIRDIATQPAIRNASGAPANGILVTITDVSKVQNFKKQLGSKYAVAPLPFIDSEKTIRLGSYLGYKFYGVNNQLSAEDKTKAMAVAKFLCSEYVQAKRFDAYNVRPTLSVLTDYAKDEPHVAALTAMEASHSTIPLTAIASELWSQTASAVTSIKALPATATDSQYTAVLAELDSALTK